VTVDEFLEELRSVPGIALHPPADERDVAAVEDRYGIRLPSFHRELLLKTNGIEACDGYLRLFGVGPNAAIDMGQWNEPQLWKFACDPLISEHFCIAEDGFGNQLASHRDDLQSGSLDAELHFFPAELQRPAHVDSVTGYLCNGFLANAKLPGQSDAAVRKKLGPLDASEHVIYSPPPLIGGDGTAENAMKMPAVMAMIINGDVWREYTRISRGLTYYDFTIVSFEPFVDEKGRPRMRLVSDEDIRAGRG